ncbi:MAG: hypothetical protein JKX80_00905 [Candidatus Pacebacteria bacterium]|nr:hypothetical protein [Candidatus Paceibacterota bacterium]
MRKRNNAQKFPHVPKNSAEKDSYLESVYGEPKQTVKDSGTPEFSETDEGRPLDETNAEIISEDDDTGDGNAKPPYISWKTWTRRFFRVHGATLSIGILISFFGWATYTVINQDKEIAVMETRLNGTISDIEDLEDHYSTLNDISIESAAAINGLISDLNIIKVNLLRGSLK